MILDLTASRLCCLISKEIERINPTKYKENSTTYGDVIELALLNLYNDVANLDNKELNLIYEPMELEEITIPVKYIDDITNPKKQRQNIAQQEALF